MNNIESITSKHTPGKLAWLLLSAVWFTWSACENDVNAVRELGRRKLNVEEGRNISSYLSDGGIMQAHLTAPLLLRYAGDSGMTVELPNTLHVDFYNDSQKVQSQLRANYGRFYEDRKQMYLSGNVLAFNNIGDTLFCEDLYWDQNRQMFYTHKKVTISRNYRSTLIVGLDGMSANQDLKAYTVFRIQPNSYSYVQDSTMNGDTEKKDSVVTNPKK
ncbi:MAG TPA: LPS export ABC transporter periplasmic protein LptC [Sediminibacterium sp.]|nr:LPS export ABC transporter periplasmic protein LptC [Sediminibacterium sp.]